TPKTTFRSTGRVRGSGLGLRGNYTNVKIVKLDKPSGAARIDGPNRGHVNVQGRKLDLRRLAEASPRQCIFGKTLAVVGVTFLSFRCCGKEVFYHPGRFFDENTLDARRKCTESKQNESPEGGVSCKTLRKGLFRSCNN